MRKTVAKLMVVAIAGALMAPVAASATHPAADPNGCKGSIGGQYVSHANNVQIPKVAEGGIIPINDANNGPFYLDLRDLASEYLVFSIWLYQETNGTKKLQRGGRAILPDTPGTSGVETCTEGSKWDTAIF